MFVRACSILQQLVEQSQLALTALQSGSASGDLLRQQVIELTRQLEEQKMKHRRVFQRLFCVCCTFRRHDWNTRRPILLQAGVGGSAQQARDARAGAPATAGWSRR